MNNNILNIIKCLVLETLEEPLDFLNTNKRNVESAISLFDEIRTVFPQLSIKDDEGNIVLSSSQISEMTPIFFGSGTDENICFFVSGIEKYIPLNANVGKFMHTSICKFTDGRYVFEAEYPSGVITGSAQNLKDSFYNFQEDVLERGLGQKEDF